MPPAFNLSQDQTLQFNLWQETHTDVWIQRPTARAAGPRTRFIQCEYYETSSTRTLMPREPWTAGFPAAFEPVGCPSDLAPSTHTYRLFTLLKSERPNAKTFRALRGGIIPQKRFRSTGPYCHGPNRLTKNLL